MHGFGGKEWRGGEEKLSFFNLHGNLSDTNIHRPDENGLFLFESEDMAVIRDKWTEGTGDDQLKQRQRKEKRYEETEVRWRDEKRGIITVNGSYLKVGYNTSQMC